MKVTQVLRTYLGMSQVTLAREAGISQPDLSEIEILPAYGKTGKYQRLSEYLGVPIDTLVKNDFTAIPESFFEKHPIPAYTPKPKESMRLIGRQGERYTVVYINNWGKEEQAVSEIPYAELEKGYSFVAHHYLCAPKSEKKQEPVNGLTHFRLTRGLRQVDVAKELGVAPSNYCQYERGQVRPSITFYIRASKFYNTTVDSLLATYDRTDSTQEMGTCVQWQISGRRKTR